MSARADGLAHEAREIASARQQLGDLVARRDACELQRLGRLAIRIARHIRSRAIRVGNRGREERRHLGRGRRAATTQRPSRAKRQAIVVTNH